MGPVILAHSMRSSHLVNKIRCFPTRCIISRARQLNAVTPGTCTIGLADGSLFRQFR